MFGITYNKFDFYNITEIADKKYKILDRALKRIIVRRVFTIHQLEHFLIIDLEKDVKIQIQTSGYNRWLFPFRPNQKGCYKFYYPCLFSYKTVRVSKLCTKIRKELIDKLVSIE